MPRRLVVTGSTLFAAAVLVTAVLRAGEAPADTKSAQSEETPPAASAPDVPRFSALDVNADTAISAEEAKAHPRLAAIFVECDADKNGSLNTWEFAEARNKLNK
jgi:hypothetical protein